MNDPDKKREVSDTIKVAVRVRPKLASESISDTVVETFLNVRIHYKSVVKLKIESF